MKVQRLLVSILLVKLVASVPVWGKDDTVSFVIAPPPVGYPIFEAGYQDWSGGGDFIYLRTKGNDTSFQVFGGLLYVNFQYCFSHRFALSGYGGGTFLMGNKYDLRITQVPLQLNGTYEIFKTPLTSVFVLGGIGGDFGLTTMSIDVPQPMQSPPFAVVMDPTTVLTTTITGRFSGGIQVNQTLGDFILSPFGVFTYTAGSYWTEQRSAMSYDYPSSSGSVPGYSTTILGFDLLYKPWNVSLSSQFQNSERTTLFSLAMKWLLSRKGS